MSGEQSHDDKAGGVHDDETGKDELCELQGDAPRHDEGGGGGEVPEADGTDGEATVGGIYHPENFYLDLGPGLARINWMRRVGESQYLECGVRFAEGALSGGCQIWILSVNGGDFIPLFAWSGMTDEEFVTVIDTLRAKRAGSA